VNNGHTTIGAKPTTGRWEPPRGPASPEKTLTEVGVGEQGGRHPDDCGWRAPCGVGGLRGGALPSNISWALEEIEAANLRELHTPTTTRGTARSCRVRIYLPHDVLDAPVVVCSELPNNPGGSITNSAETIAAGMIRYNELLGAG
jgi:hypothetical protein